MRRRLAVLGIGLLASLALGGLPAEGKLPDAGTFKGSYSYLYSEEHPGGYYYYAYYRFSRIGFQGTISSGQKTYTGYFYIEAGLVGRALADEIGCSGGFGCLEPSVYFGRDIQVSNRVGIHGTSNGQRLQGTCGGPDTQTSGGAGYRHFRFACTISVNGSVLRPIAIEGTAAASVPGVSPFLAVETPVHAGAYTAAPAAS